MLAVGDSEANGTKLFLSWGLTMPWARRGEGEGNGYVMLGDGKCCEHHNTGKEPELGRDHVCTWECGFLALYGPRTAWGSEVRAEWEARCPVSQVVPGTS